MSEDSENSSEDWLISVDDHVIEPAHIWVDRLSKADRERGPRQVEVDGVMQWTYEDKVFSTRGLWAAAGKKKEEFSPEPISYEDMRPGLLRPRRAPRRHGPRRCVLASLCFPSFPRFCGQTFYEAKDREPRPQVRRRLQRLDDRRVGGAAAPAGSFR